MSRIIKMIIAALAIAATGPEAYAAKDPVDYSE